MPARTGPSSCSTVLPIFPSPSARSVPRCRSLCPIWLRTCVTRTLLMLQGRRLLQVRDGLQVLAAALLVLGARRGNLPVPPRPPPPVRLRGRAAPPPVPPRPPPPVRCRGRAAPESAPPTLVLG